MHRAVSEPGFSAPMAEEVPEALLGVRLPILLCDEIEVAQATGPSGAIHRISKSRNDGHDCLNRITTAALLLREDDIVVSVREAPHHATIQPSGIASTLPGKQQDRQSEESFRI